MTSPLQLEDHAPWRQRFRSGNLGYVYVAPESPSSGIVHATLGGPAKRIFTWDTSSGDLRPLLPDGETPAYGWLGPKGDYLYYLQDDGGSELGHIVRVPLTGGPAEDLTPDLPPYTLRGFDISRNGACLAFDAVYDNRYWFYCIALASDGSSSPPQLVYTAREETWACHLSYDGALLAVKSTHRAPHSRRYTTLVFNTNSGEHVAELWDGSDYSVEPVQFSPLRGDERLLAASNASGALLPLLWDPRSNERRDITVPSAAGSVLPLDWSPDGGKLLVQTRAGKHEGLFIYNLNDEDLLPLQHEPGAFRGRTGPYHTGTAASFFAPDGTVWAQWSDASHPSQLLSLTTTDRPKPILPVAHCPPGRPWRSVSFPGSDGVSVQAWLGIPSSSEGSEGPFPAILHVHGGPSGAASNAFDAPSQAWLDHGFAYLTVNYRGSTGFGRDFQEKINGDVGRWELEDMVAARRWLIGEGIADPNGILLEGGSYGGFLTVWALSQEPDLWAGGIAPVAIVDWTMNYEDSSAAMKGWARMIFDGTPQEKPELYRDRSPLTHAAAIQAPLLIFQGRRDSRATPRQMERFARKMEALQKDFTLVWLDSGHGLPSAATAEHIQETHLKFAYRVLGLQGRDVD
ncbi:MAG: S9 family peptidase [Caldilineaceae bacterium SB0661_bin_32]|uniref:Acyl-peptide hydrolase n=1 Tax=Caldilineaceae bacterium SB0661_bin_32 TaxID=2605255 RepID=A0A6B1DBV7_9CHLR|nr:S9 family peptidase [Caldilineaceae bacterium SB0661_bin_32]